MTTDPAVEPTIEETQLSLEDRVAELERIIRTHIGEPVAASGDTVASTGPFYAVDRVSPDDLSPADARESTSYGDLDTPGPEVQIEVSESGIVIVGISSWIKYGANVDNLGGSMSFDMGPAADPDGVFNAGRERSITNCANRWMSYGASFMFDNLTPGELLTVEAKYAALTEGVNAAFQWREVWAYSPALVTVTPTEEVPA